MAIHPSEGHRANAVGGWLRAAVLGADDGIVSTASLLVGVMASSGSRHAVLVAGVAGLFAGALSMAAGEYVAVSAQRDTELADIEIEKRELRANPAGELRELAGIYESRGLSPELAMQVAEALSAKDRLHSHLRDELGMTDTGRARPLVAALASAASFASLAVLPLTVAALCPIALGWIAVPAVALASLALLGAIGAHLGGGSKLRGATRVLVGGGLAMALSALAGHLVGGGIG